MALNPAWHRLVSLPALEGEGALQEGEWRTLEEQVKERIEEAFDRASRSPDPEPETALEDVYA